VDRDSGIAYISLVQTFGNSIKRRQDSPLSSFIPRHSHSAALAKHLSNHANLGLLARCARGFCLTFDVRPTVSPGFRALCCTSRSSRPERWSLPVLHVFKTVTTSGNTHVWDYRLTMIETRSRVNSLVLSLDASCCRAVRT
jgi:hypothetical protein